MSFRDRPLRSRVRLPVRALAGQANRLELRSYRVPGHRSRILQARDEPQRQSRALLTGPSDRCCKLYANHFHYYGADLAENEYCLNTLLSSLSATMAVSNTTCLARLYSK